MQTQHKLSLLTATFININIMLGSGIFINTVILAKYAGLGGSLAYCLIGIVMFPLVICMVTLMRNRPNGTLFALGSLTHPLIGVASTTIYFVGKLASAALGIHVFSSFFQQVVPSLHVIPILVLDIVIVSFFVLLNLLNIRTGSRIQYGFIILKLIPIVFVFLSCIWLYNPHYLHPSHIILQGIPLSLPLALFCFVGFEATCSLFPLIDKPSRNAPRAIIYSYIIVIMIAALFQGSLYTQLGPLLGYQANYLTTFSSLLAHTMLSGKQILLSILSIAMATSALGAAYGILYSNTWNLYTLAQHYVLPGSSILTLKNKHHIPQWCVVVEGIICCIYLLTTKGYQVPLQYSAAFVCTASYAMSIISLFIRTRSLMSILGLCNCSILLATCLYGFYNTNITPLIILLCIVGVELVYAHCKMRFNAI